MAEVKWIKLSTDLFDNRKIKQLRKMPDGDALIVVWMQILCLAGRTNTGGGMVLFAEGIPYTDELLAVEFDRPITLIRLALTTFEKFRMIEIIDDVLCICNWEKYQSEAKLEVIRTYERDRKRASRAKQKEKLLKCPGQVPECPDTDIISISNSLSNDLNLNEKKVKHKYGEYKNVLLSDEQMEKLKTEFPDYEERIERVSEYCASTGKSYKDYLATIRAWAKKEKKQNNTDTGLSFKEMIDRGDFD